MEKVTAFFFRIVTSVMVWTIRKRKNARPRPVVDWISAVALKNDCELAVDCKKWALQENEK